MKKPLTQGVQTGPILTQELQSAINIWIRIAQHHGFQSEIDLIRKKKTLPIKNKLSSLTPFIDNEGLLRVGGRLEEVNIDFSHKHPVILPKDHPLTLLLVQDYHRRYLHAGQRLLTSIICLRYWIIGCRYLVKKVIYSCVTCLRYRSQPCSQRMGNLPSFRLQPTRPFQNTGLDYAGPLQVRSWKGRGHKTYKAYIALFVCLSTKAYHLELVSSLSSDDFLAALNRFTARRGLPSHIYSDNGTTFVGANRELKIVGELLRSREHQERIITYAAERDISWHFIPPSAPHFGGVWESGIKAVKRHLYREMKNALLTFEEVTTLLCQIEALLNSRPLTPKSLEPNDYDVLTPAHFLIGSSLLTVPEHFNENRPISALARWQYVTRLNKSFWRRWSMEYMTQLHQRSKWKSVQPNLQLDDVVIIKDENLPPSSWLLGRVTELHPGKDNLVRVVTLSTKTGVLERPITKVCLLPRNLI